MVTRIDARQSRQRALLDQLSLNTDVKLDTLLNLINDELQPLLRLRQANPSSLVLNVDAISVTTSDSGDGHGRTRTIQPISGVLPSFTPGSITFPGATGGSITATGVTLAAAYTLTVAPNNWIKVLLALNTDGQIVLTFGTTGASEAAAGFPDVDTGTLPIGYVSMQNDGSGTIQNVTGSRIYQFAGGGGGGSGTGSGTFKNYLSKWFDGEANITGVNNGGVSDTGNRSAADTVWASTNTTNITVGRNAGIILRGKNSILVNSITGSGTGSTFVETPVFTLDTADRDLTSSAFLFYVSFVFSVPSSNVFDVVLVRYNSAGVFQEKIPVYGVFGNSGAVPPSQFVSTNTTNNRYFGYSAKIASGVAATDKLALRIRGLGNLGMYLEDLYVGPNADMNNGNQRFIGQKEHADRVQHRQGTNFPLNMDLTVPGTPLSVLNNETKMVGKLDILTGTGIFVDTGCNLVTVGSITGPGTLSGAGTVTSI